MLKRVLRKAKRLMFQLPVLPAKTLDERNAEYWNIHNVTRHAQFATVQESLDYLDHRNDQYPGYIDMLPVSGQDQKVVLDYGCGPGHDLVGFGHFSRPRRLIGMDVSPSSLEEARARLQLHGIPAQLVQIRPDNPNLPLDGASIDYIHSSGVVHHTINPAAVLREFRRVLRPDGTCRIMVYNYDSLWMHLYVAYVKRVKEGKYKDLDDRAAFARTTDGEGCPVSRVYKSTEFVQLAEECGFQCRFLGAAMSLWELSLFPQRFDAALHPGVAAEHRKFLLGLTMDDRGYPLHQGYYAGVDACYELKAA
jgi:SAM-dependent methyltransferase